MFEAFYGLKGPPFQLNPDPSFFYGSYGHKSALAYLRYGLHQGEGFIVITGEVGAGKTTLIRSLLEKLDRQKIVAAQLVSTQLDSENLLRAVATAFGLSIRTQYKAQLLAEIEAFLTSLVPSGKRALLVVDEAQNLTPRAVEELRMLSNYQLDSHGLLQSVLVGQPELREVMRSSRMKQLRQRVIASYHLGPMDRKETQGYIEHRLARMGWTGDPQFTPAAMDEIFRTTGGIPRRINIVCNRLLVWGYLGEQHVVRDDDVKTVVSEMADEGGLDLNLGGPPEAEADSSQAQTAESMIDTRRNGLNAVAEISEESGAPALESRVMRLERTMFTVLDLLAELVRDERRCAKKRESH